MSNEDMKLHRGRPDSMEGRQEREIRVYDFLDSLGIEYWQVDNSRPAYTMEDCEDVDSILEATIVKNLFLCNRQQTQFYLLMMPGEKKFKTKELSRQLSVARLSFADEARMVEFLDIHPGSVSVLGLMNDRENRVRLLIDEDILKGEFFGCHPCVNTSSLKIRMKDLLETFLPAVHHEPTFVHLVGED